MIDARRQLEVAGRERDAARAELRKSNALRDRLEELCRGLQAQARDVAEEAKRRGAEEAKQRQEVQDRFSAIIDVSS